MLLCILTGILGGGLAIAFHLGIFLIFGAVWKFGGSFGEANRLWIMPIFPALGGLIVGVCIKLFAHSAAGSGIPQTKECFYNNFGIFKFSDIIYRFTLGIIFCGFGNSAGREGPTVHLCSAAASVLAQKMNFAKSKVREAVPVGMAAGIAASFNAPLSAISFVFEELFGGKNRLKNIGGIIISVAIAAALSRIIISENPIINIPRTDFRTGWWMLVCIPIALCAGAVGDLFLSLLLKLRGRAKFRCKIPQWLLPAIGGLIVGCIATFAYVLTGYNTVFSVGYAALIPAFGGNIIGLAMLALFAFKFVATIINYSFGGSGGLFSPTLVIGGMLGGAIGSAASYCGIIEVSEIGACVLLGMGACFASIIRCPITSIIMIFELTLNYSLIIPLLGGNFLAYAIARSRNKTGLYDSLLMQDGISLRKLPSYGAPDELKSMPCASIATYRPICFFANQTCEDGLKSIGEIRHKFYPIVDNAGNYCGLVSHKDISIEQNAGKLCAEFARQNDIFASCDDTIAEVSRKLVENDIQIVAILSNRTLIGLLTLHDIANMLIYKEE